MAYQKNRIYRHNELIYLNETERFDAVRLYKEEMYRLFALRPISFIYTFCASLFKIRQSSSPFFIDNKFVGLAKFQREVINEILKPPPQGQINSTVIRIPRGYAKTTICRALIAWYLLYGYHRHVLLVSKNQSKATESLNAIRTILQSQKVQWLYGQQIAESGQEIEFQKSSIKAIDNRTEIVGIPGYRLLSLGYEQGARGSNWLNERPSLILLDDIETESNTKTLERIEENAQIVASAFKDSLPTDGSGQIIYLFTAIDEDCVGNRLLKPELSDSWKQVSMSAMWIEKKGVRMPSDYYSLRAALLNDKLDPDEEIKMLFPEMQNVYQLKAKWKERLSLGTKAERAFCFDYLGLAPTGNLSLDPDAILPLNYTLRYRKTGVKSGYLFLEIERGAGVKNLIYVEPVIGIDLAGERNTSNDETCLFPYLTDSNGNQYLLPFSADKFSLYDDNELGRLGFIDELFRIYEALGQVMTEIAIEIVSVQDHFYKLILNEAIKRGYSLSNFKLFTNSPPSSKAKNAKIVAALSPVLQSPSTFVYYSPTLTFLNKKFDILKLQRQMRALGNNTLADDVVDAWAIGAMQKSSAIYARKITQGYGVYEHEPEPVSEDAILGKEISSGNFEPYC